MSRLVFGVLDVAYSDAHGPGGDTLKTTGDVAELLEQRYGVMRYFFALRQDAIAQHLADGMATAIQDLVAGHPRLGNTMFDASQRIEHEFRSFIYANEMQKLAVALTGSPISSAADRGVNHRKKMPYSKKNKPRPAFVDTGLYVQSFRCEVQLSGSADV